MAAFESFLRTATGRRVRTWLAGGFISAYLAVLGGGLFCHTFGWNAGAHPLMYFVVWDMFCGWSAYDTRFHVLAEGVSGEYYDVLPGPWGDLHPHGNLSRHHYDIDGVYAGRMAMNVLRHTSHEDVTRLLVVEETWPKKFNMPDDQWVARFDGPKNPKRYYTLRNVITADGVLLQSYPGWVNGEAGRAVMSNPRLAAESHRAKPFLAVDVRRTGGRSEFDAAASGATPRFGAPWGN